MKIYLPDSKLPSHKLDRVLLGIDRWLREYAVAQNILILIAISYTALLTLIAILLARAIFAAL